jgi:type I restriction enzyme M protein
MANGEKSLENWLWDAACAIRGEKDAPKYKDYILPLVFVKRLCDVFDDEVNRIAKQVGSRTNALKLIDKDHKLVRFYLPLRVRDVEKDDTWSVIRLLADNVGEQLTGIMRDIARYNSRIEGIIDRIDFNATTHGQRDLTDESLIKLIERISQKRLGLADVEADIIGRSYEYLIRKFAEGGGQSAGEFYTPREVGMIMARIMNAEPGMEVYDPCCGSGGLLIKCELALNEKMAEKGIAKFAPLKLYGQENTPMTWAMGNMNMVIHDMEGTIEIGNTMTSPKFRVGQKLKQFDIVEANPMWNQDNFTEEDYEKDELDRFGAGFPPNGSADWGWMQHILTSLKNKGRAAVILDTGSVSRGSGNASNNREKNIRKWFIDQDLIEGVIYLPENLFYNTTSAGVIVFLNKNKNQSLRDKVFMLNASLDFEKGAPKNFINTDGQNRIVESFLNHKAIDKFSMLVSKADIALKNDYNISPSRYIHTTEAEKHRPINEILDDLNELEGSATEVDKELKGLLKKIGY